jgi:hypothetical protein
VVEYVEGKAPPPYELELRWDCLEYSCLPYPGGMVNQPIRLMHRMKVAQNTYNAWQVWKRCKTGEEKMKFAENYPAYFAIVECYLEVGKWQIS